MTWQPQRALPLHLATLVAQPGLPQKGQWHPGALTAPGTPDASENLPISGPAVSRRGKGSLTCGCVRLASEGRMQAQAPEWLPEPTDPLVRNMAELGKGLGAGASPAADGLYGPTPKLLWRLPWSPAVGGTSTKSRTSPGLAWSPSQTRRPGSSRDSSQPLSSSKSQGRSSRAQHRGTLQWHPWSCLDPQNESTGWWGLFRLPHGRRGN